jgi:hypothetical protein
MVAVAARENKAVGELLPKSDVIPSFLAIALAAGLLLATSTAGAADLRLGVLAHDVPVFGSQREHGVDLNAELLFVSPVPDAVVADAPHWTWLLQPRPMLGVEANTGGYTSQLYFGLTWTVWQLPDVITQGDAIFLNLGLGPAFNNGRIHSNASDHQSLGANLLFRESLEIGYRVSGPFSVSLFFDHSSNGGIDRYNHGLDNFGVRAGYAF